MGEELETAQKTLLGVLLQRKQRNGAVTASGSGSKRRFCRTGEITAAYKSLWESPSREGNIDKIEGG